MHRAKLPRRAIRLYRAVGKAQVADAGFRLAEWWTKIIEATDTTRVDYDAHQPPLITLHTRSTSSRSIPM